VSEQPHPLIVYVPGLLPKPEPEIHREALLRCLLTGVRRVDTEVADAIESNPAAFDLVAWTYDFYLEHRDFELDRAGVDAVVDQAEASAEDIAEATSLRRRFARWIYRLGDLVPFLIPHLAPENVEVHLRDLMRYVRDENGIAAHTREMLKMRLRAADESREPVLLISHSMGSVIAWDSLWELSHSGRDHLRLDMLLTMGSPLGQRFLQERIKGGKEVGSDRFPGNVRRWKNLAAIGDLTSLDRRLADDFAEMLDLGLVESIEDEALLAYFRFDGELNAHSEYGYLVHEKTARTIVEWWRGHEA
jgi:hypothetical protein